MKLIYYRSNFNVPMPEMRPGRIDFFDLTLVLFGKLEYILDGKSLTVKKGDAVIIPPGTQRARKAVENAVYFSFNYITEPTDACLSLPPFLSGVATSAVRALLTAADEIHKHTLSGEDTAQMTLITQCILAQLQADLSADTQNATVLAIKNYIKEHLHEQINLTELCKSVFFSPAYCTRTFKKATGRSIMDYCIDEKTEEAKRRILEGTSLTHVAYTLGFSDYNYFSRMFKKRTGMSPLQFKKLHLT